MYEQFFGLSENPFSLTPDPRFIFPSRTHDEALAHLRYWVEHREGFAMITGEVGTGKTTALFRLIEGMDRHFEIGFLTNSTLNAVELLEEICRKFRIEVEKDLSKPALLAKFEAFLVRLHEMGHGAVLIIDEAQNFDHLLLEEIRLLSNVTRPGGTPLLQIALVGQPELERKLSLPELRQLKQRIGVHYRIEPLSQEETGRYVHHRVTVAGGYPRVLFPPETMSMLFARTHGLPREINQVASQSLLHAYVEESTAVRPDHIDSAIAEMGFKSVLDRGVTLTVTPPVPAPARAASTSPLPAHPGIGSPRPAPTPARPEAAPPPHPATPPARAAAGAAPAPAPAPPPPILTAAPPPPPVRLPSEPRRVSAGSGVRPMEEFGALPPVHAMGDKGEPRNPVVRRIAVSAAAVVILGAAALMLFGPPKAPQDDIKDLESEATMPRDPRSNAVGDRAASPAGSTAVPTPATGARPDAPSGGTTENSTPAPTVVPDTRTNHAVRDSIEHKPATSLAGAGPAPTSTVSSAAPTPPAGGAAGSSEAAIMGAWHLQVASLRDSSIAESVGRRLASAVGTAFHVDAEPGGEFPWFAVYLGPYATRADAESARVELAVHDRHVADAIVRPPSTR